MSKTFHIFPYAQGSKGAKLLAEELGCPRIKREGSSFNKNPDRIVINWGASDCPKKYDAINQNIKAVLNKKAFFERLVGTDLIPPCAFNKLDAADNLSFPIFCRTKLEGKDGEGIVIAEKFSQLVEAKLYTQYIDKTSEYRLHVGRGPNGYTVIGSQKKVKKTIPEGENLSPDARIMTGDGVGLVWTVNSQPVFIPDPVKAVVKKAFELFPEIDFCAFDVIFDNSTGKAYVLEANSAPMGTPETMKRYAKFFKSLHPDAVPQNVIVAEEVPATPAPAAAPAAPAPATPVATVMPVITVQQVTAAQDIINAYIQQTQQS
jgi:hypothetical protein